MPGFRSLLGEFPKNTIGVYSYSKYFGCSLAPRRHRAARAQHPRREARRAAERRAAGAGQTLRATDVTPRAIRFIDRIVADSRDIALNHTAGLSLPQQVMMTLFSLAELSDDAKYQQACIEILRKRVEATIKASASSIAQPAVRLGTTASSTSSSGCGSMGRRRRAGWKANVHPLDIVFRLAEDHGIVLLNGGGFEAPDWSVRVSFANLDDDVYENIGRAVRAVARSYVVAYRAAIAAAPACRSVDGRHMGEAFVDVLREHPEVTFFSSSGSATCSAS